MLRGNEYEVESKRVLVLAENSKCSAYGCEFVSLADELDLNLVTSDKKLIKTFQDIVIPLNNY